ALAWQKQQTDLWWEKAEELKNALAWQKQQTDLWWEKAEELKNALAWQKQQTDLWWEKAEELTEEIASVYNIKNSLTWKFFSVFRKIIDKILPIGSRRRKKAKNFLRRLVPDR
ncbi:MAG: hypothetical protein ACK4ND_18940, partial [Cytophagaceae bacterium]